ncbi:MAG: hypothetical protein ACLTXL_03275 [Clostridia bacterium]
MTQANLAEKLGISDQRYQNGRRGSLCQIPGLCWRYVIS